MTGGISSANGKYPTVSHEIGQWCVYPDFKEIVNIPVSSESKEF